MLTKKLGDIFNSLICISAICFLLIYPMYCIESAKEGLSTALYIVLPSIFPFMVLSRFIISSGLHFTASKFIGKPFEKLFGVDRQYATVFLLGCLGGYPIGSIILSGLLKKQEISKETAEHLVGICNNASPMFITGTVGTLILKSTYYGYVLYAIHLFCVCLCGFIMKIIFKAELTGNITYKKSQKNNFPLSEAVTSSGINMLNIASYIIIFSVISEFIVLLFKNTDCSFILCLLEITIGIKHCTLSSMPEIIKISMISFALGFSGLCVFSQSKAVFGDLNISFYKYFFAKFLIATLSFITTYFVFTIIFSH